MLHNYNGIAAERMTLISAISFNPQMLMSAEYTHHAVKMHIVKILKGAICACAMMAIREME